jgi:hypothetical protein
LYVFASFFLPFLVYDLSYHLSCKYISPGPGICVNTE